VFETTARELAKCKSDLLEVQEEKWEKGGNEPADYYAFFYGNENLSHHPRTEDFVFEVVL
jgi:hypothetical protein